MNTVTPTELAKADPATAVASRKRGVVLVEPPGMKGYLPIAAGYLVAAAKADPALDAAYDFNLILRAYNHPFEEVLQETFECEPDVVALSCQGWAILRADALAKRLRDRFPNALIVYGGNHVSNEGGPFFAERPFADVLVNGEGEHTFVELLHARLQGDGRTFADIEGLSWRDPWGAVHTNPDRPRISVLDTLPSPYLTGVLKPDPEIYTTALLETNRGCPYQCSFCYWGTATQSKVRAFSIERLEQEMELLAKAQIDTWFIADANFGILKQDPLIVDSIVAIRQKYGFPKTVNTNWAKHSNERVIKICAQLNQSGIHSSYTLALQSTDAHTLELANRKNMSINKVDDIARLCRAHGVIPKGELIWGLPGENYETFLKSYDDLAQFTDTLSVYPLYILPNTEYSRKVEEYKIQAKRVEMDTVYEYCVSHIDMSEQDFIHGVKFIISNNILRVAGNFLYTYPRVANTLGIPYSAIIEKFAPWVAATSHPSAQRFRKYFRFPLATHRQSLQETWNALTADRDGLLDALRQYLIQTFHQDLSGQESEMLLQALDFDFALYPQVDTPDMERSAVGGHYEHVARYDYDFLSVYQGEAFNPVKVPTDYRFRSPAGFGSYPIENWYFGLISYRARVDCISHPAEVAAE